MTHWNKEDGGKNEGRGGGQILFTVIEPAFQLWFSPVFLSAGVGDANTRFCHSFIERSTHWFKWGNKPHYTIHFTPFWKFADSVPRPCLWWNNSRPILPLTPSSGKPWTRGIGGGRLSNHSQGLTKPSARLNIKYSSVDMKNANRTHPEFIHF
jgi:hypothetical protein